jgi:hypothetical protein
MKNKKTNKPKSGFYTELNKVSFEKQLTPTQLLKKALEQFKNMKGG